MSALHERVDAATGRLYGMVSDIDDCLRAEVKTPGFSITAEYADWEAGSEEITGWLVTVSTPDGREWRVLEDCLNRACRRVTEKIKKQEG